MLQACILRKMAREGDAEIQDLAPQDQEILAEFLSRNLPKTHNPNEGTHE
ncbi:MAG: hypothetical protein H6865_04080 [Rhodospirillales bacterium]|nr:hypothetical protein [Rhodospirillales bacterium]